MKRILKLFICLLPFAMQSCSSNETTNPREYKTENIENMKEVYEFVKSCGYYFIATVDGDQPRVRPFGTVNIFEDKLYIQTGHVKRTAQQITKNPKIEICAYNGTTEWMRIEATLVEDERVEAKRAMLDAYPSLKKMYDAEDNNTAVYFLTKVTAYKSSFSEPESVIKF